MYVFATLSTLKPPPSSSPSHFLLLPNFFTPPTSFNMDPFQVFANVSRTLDHFSTLIDQQFSNPFHFPPTSSSFQWSTTSFDTSHPTTSYIQPTTFDNDIGSSYQELLALDENNVSSGMTKDQIDHNTVIESCTTHHLPHGPCVICLDQFELAQNLRRLPCLCFYHSDCIDKHLENAHECPKCRHNLKQ